MKRISKLLFCLTILVSIFCSVHAQNAARNWLFGNFARIDFNGASPVASTVTTISTNEGSSSISDSSGNLLFYTDGVTVWNKNHTPMLNGLGLMGNSSSTQSALIVPCSCNKYFIFTTGVHENSYNNGFRYSVVDMSLDNNLGGVEAATKNTILLTRASEKVAAVGDDNGGFWVVAHNMTNNQFYSYHLLRDTNCVFTPNLKTVKISAVGTAYTIGTTYGVGQMKISPNKKRLAVALYGSPSFVELFQFDIISGLVSNLGPGGAVVRDSLPTSYGLEFSPNSLGLYAVDPFARVLYRYNLSLDTLTLRTTLGTLAGTSSAGSLQLAPDGKIYIARFGGVSLDVLNAPDSASGGAITAFNLFAGSSGRFGLPTMVAGDFACGQQGCCDQVKQTPFWTPDLSLSWKAFEVFNVKYPGSNICSIDIDIRSATNAPPPNPWNGGGLKVNGTALAVPTWWKSPYVKIPNGNNAQTVIAGMPNFSAAAVNFNLGLDYSGTYTGKVKLIFRHCDGTTCEYLSDNWTPEPPTQLTMRVSERYLGDLRGEYLPLALGFSDGINIKSNAKWIAVEPIDADTEVFSVDGDRVSGGELLDGTSQLMIASARKLDRSALYELTKPVNLERFTGSEIKLVLKRSQGNAVRPRLRFLFFDESANLIGYAMNDKW